MQRFRILRFYVIGVVAVIAVAVLVVSSWRTEFAGPPGGLLGRFLEFSVSRE
jgi:hypothetical protein